MGVLRAAQAADQGEPVSALQPSLTQVERHRQVMECSAKSNSNIQEVFKCFLQLAKIPVPSDELNLLRRRSSAHASVSKVRSPNTLSPLPQPQPPTLSEEETAAGSSAPSTSSTLKPRTRSLIRRSSKKQSNKVKDANSDPEDCIVS